MKKKIIPAFSLLERVRKLEPVVHHLTNWVTIYDCANIVKVLGGSPVMAHAPEEVAQMTALSSSLVLNIGTLTSDFVDAMVIAGKSANKKGIPVIFDACGAGATQLRDKKSFELLKKVDISIIKGNASEVARLAGAPVKTRGVDATDVDHDVIALAAKLSRRYGCTAVVTGAHDVIINEKTGYVVKNGHPIMADVVGTGCMAASVIATFAAVEKDLALASAAGLVCYEVAAECAVKRSKGPGTFKEQLFDGLYNLNKRTLQEKQKVYGVTFS